MLPESHWVLAAPASWLAGPFGAGLGLALTMQRRPSPGGDEREARGGEGECLHPELCLGPG